MYAFSENFFTTGTSVAKQSSTVQLLPEAMKMRQQFKLQGTPDPFTLLKVSQAFREISCGESLELIYSGEHIPDELFKILPARTYKIIVQDQYEDPLRYRIVLQKTAIEPAAGDEPSNGCQCS